MTANIGRIFPTCIEPQGEAIAIKHDGKGCYTISEAEDTLTDIDIPIYYHPFHQGTT